MGPVEELTHAEFVTAYCRGSGMMVGYFHQNFSALPCNCGRLMCLGWTVKPDDPVVLRAYRDDYLRFLH